MDLEEMKEKNLEKKKLKKNKVEDEEEEEGEEEEEERCTPGDGVALLPRHREAVFPRDLLALLLLHLDNKYYLLDKKKYFCHVKEIHLLGHVLADLLGHVDALLPGHLPRHIRALVHLVLLWHLDEIK